MTLHSAPWTQSPAAVWVHLVCPGRGRRVPVLPGGREQSPRSAWDRALTIPSPRRGPLNVQVGAEPPSDVTGKSSVEAVPLWLGALEQRANEACTMWGAYQVRGEGSLRIAGRHAVTTFRFCCIYLALYPLVKRV